jgi:hypothetical protein
MECILGEIRDVLGHQLEFSMVEGFDGKSLESGQSIDEIQKSYNFSLYTNWAITDPEDLERLDPELVKRIAFDIEAPGQQLTSIQMNEPNTYIRLWRAYEDMYTRFGWQRERARHYTDFHNRHITTGEVCRHTASFALLM